MTRNPFLLAIASLLLANIALFGLAGAEARDCDECADGYGECYQIAGTAECECDQFIYDDCDLCAVDPCSSVWPEYCEGPPD